MSLADYTIEAEIGRGASGRVFRARHVATGATRAVKMIEAGAADLDAIVRFERETRSLVRLGGDGVVPVHEAGTDRRGHYLVMGFMPGGSLRDRLAKGRLDWREAVGIALALARALERCHAAGIVHRDLKPENVLFDDQGKPRLADFGMVRDLGGASLTQTGALVGTPAYMAPEQLDGVKADARADVYALGLILEELVTGERPFSGARSVLALIEAKTKGNRSAVARHGAPAALDAVLDRALAPRVQNRTPRATELARELEAVLAARDGPSVRPRGLLAAALLVVVAGALIVHSTSLGGVRPDPVAAAPPPPPPSLHKLDASGRSALLGAVRRDWIEGACAAAVQLCEKAARGGDPWVEALLADAHLEAGDVEGALAIVGSWTLGSDGDARALSVRAFIHQSRRDADARADAESALAKDEKLARGWVVRSWILMEQAGALGPEDAPPLWDKAREAAEHARRLAPPCRATAAIAFAHADLLIQRYGGKAEPFVEPEVILDPETLGKQFLPPPEWAGWAREKGEVALIFAGDARGATELNPYRSQAWVHLARSGDPAFFDEAMAHAERLDSWNPSVVQWRVRRHLADRRWDDALDLLAFQARRLPESAIELTRARILLAAGRPGEAVAVAGSAKPKSAQEQARIFVKAALIALRAHDLEAAKRSAGLAVEAAKIAKDIGSGIAAVVWSRVCLEAGDAAGARADDVSRAGGDRYGAARRAAAARGWLAEGRVAEAADAVGAALSASPRFRAACEAAGIDVGALGAGPDGERRRLLEAVLRLPEAPDSDLIAREWVHDWPCYGDMPPD